MTVNLQRLLVPQWPSRPGGFFEFPIVFVDNTACEGQRVEPEPLRRSPSVEPTSILLRSPHLDCSFTARPEYPVAARLSYTHCRRWARLQTFSFLFYCPKWRATVSSLVEAGTVDHLRDQPQRFHRIHSLFRPLHSHRRLEGDLVSDVQRLLQCANPGEELCEWWHVLVPTHQPLPMAAQTQQGSVFGRRVDVVAIGLDLLPERAVVAAEGELEQQRFACWRFDFKFYLHFYSEFWCPASK